MSMTRVAISSSVPVLEAASSMTHCSMSFWDKTSVKTWIRDENEVRKHVQAAPTHLPEPFVAGLSVCR